MTQEEIEKLASDYLNDRESTLDMERLFEFALEALQKQQKIEQMVNEWKKNMLELLAGKEGAK